MHTCPGVTLFDKPVFFAFPDDLVLQSAAQLFQTQSLAAGHLYSDKVALGRMQDAGPLKRSSM